jgi:hypothetical protein
MPSTSAETNVRSGQQDVAGLVAQEAPLYPNSGTCILPITIASAALIRSTATRSWRPKTSVTCAWCPDVLHPSYEQMGLTVQSTHPVS